MALGSGIQSAGTFRALFIGGKIEILGEADFVVSRQRGRRGGFAGLSRRSILAQRIKVLGPFPRD